MNSYLNCWRTIVLFAVPIVGLIFLALPYLTAFFSSMTSSEKAQKGFTLKWVYAFFLVGTYWMFNVYVIPTTAFIIMFILPFLGIVGPVPLAATFMSEYNIIVFGSIVLMMAAENCGLKKRLALAILKHSSGSMRWIFIDIYLVTTWIAMWINSAAAVYFMMKIIDDVLESLKSLASRGALGEERVNLLKEIENKTQGNSTPKRMSITNLEEVGSATGHVDKTNEDNKTPDKELISAEIEKHQSENLQLLNDFGGELLYATAVAANIGGSLWPYGNPMGCAMGYVAIVADTEIYIEYTIASWLIYSFPFVIINASIALAYLLWIHFKKGRIASFLRPRMGLSSATQGRETLNTLSSIYSDQCSALPVWNRREKVIVIFTVTTIILCLTRKPSFMYGWSDAIKWEHVKTVKKDGKLKIITIGDSVVLVVITLLLFLTPSWGFQVFKGPPQTGDKSKVVETTKLGWKKLQAQYPFSILILIGAATCIGRYSLNPIAKPLSRDLASTTLQGLPSLQKIVLILIAVGFSVFMPNPGTSIAITQICVATKFWDILEIIPVTSLCFIIPASSIPTTMVYRYGNKNLSAWYFVRVGTPLLFCTLIATTIYSLLWTPGSLKLS